MNDERTTDDIPDDLPPGSPIERLAEDLPRIRLRVLALAVLAAIVAWGAFTAMAKRDVARHADAVTQEAAR